MARNNLTRFLKYYRPHVYRAAYAFVLAVAMTLLQLPMPFLSMYVIDNVLMEGNIAFLNRLVFVLVSVQLISIMAYLLQGYLLEVFRQRVYFDLQKDTFHKVLRLPMSYFQTKETGYILSRIRNDSETTKGLMADTAISIFKDIVTLIVGVCCMFALHWKLALLSCLLLPPFVASIVMGSKKIKTLNQTLQESSARLNQEIAENVALVSSIKALVIGRTIMRKYVSSLRGYIGSALRASMWSMVLGAVTILIGGIGPVLLLWYGGAEIMRGTLTFGRFFAFSTFLAYLFGPTQRLLNLHIGVQSSLVAIDRVYELLDMSEETRATRATSIPCPNGIVELQRVSYSHDPQTPIIKEITLAVRPGRLYAIVGRSGIGKTTLLNLLLGYYYPSGGCVLVDGIDTRKIDPESLRACIGYVPQGAPLFSTTIYDNIRYGNINASSEDIVMAAKLANAHHFITKLKDGYYTQAGERGARLSGGERQRVVMARAIVRKPRMYILDESLSELDSQSESLILQCLGRLKRTATVLVVTHRPSTIRQADVVCFIENGVLGGCGTHDELIIDVPEYAELFDSHAKLLTSAGA